MADRKKPLENYLSYNMTSKSRLRNIKHLNNLSKIARGDTLTKVKQIIKLYSENEIKQIRTAANMITDLIYNMTNKKKQTSITKRYDKLVEKHKKKKQKQKKKQKRHFM